MAGFWVLLALALVIASIVIAVLGIQLAAAMWLVLLAIFIVLFTERGGESTRLASNLSHGANMSPFRSVC